MFRGKVEPLGIEFAAVRPDQDPNDKRMVEMIRTEANEEGAGVLRRFALMRSWYETRHMTFADFTSPDMLHMNDWGYACLAKIIGGSIAEAAQRNIASAQVHTLAHAVTP